MAKRKNKLKKKAKRGNNESLRSQKDLAIQQALSVAVQHHNAGDLPKAEAIYQQILSTEPNQPTALQLLGVIAHQVGKNEVAVEYITKAIKIKPDYAEAYGNLGAALRELGQFSNAVDCYRKALEIKPDYVEARNNMGNALKELGRLNDAIVCYRQAIKIKPDYGEAHYNMGNTFQSLGQINEAIDCYQTALEIGKKQGIKLARINSNLLLGLNYYSGFSKEAIFTKHREWEKNIGNPVLSREPASADARQNTSLRVGYVSPDFRTHSVAYFFEPLLVSHDSKVVEVYCYYNNNDVDSTTQRLKDASDHWRSIINLSDEEVVSLIRQDHIDILVDLAGHTAKNRLPVFTYKPAPIQVTWLGYPNTTGLSNMDYRFTDDIADPVGEADQWCTEELIRLPNGFLCYEGDDQIDFEPTLPCRERGYVTFGSFNNVIKTNLEVIKLWAKLLKAVPGSHLLLKSNQLVDKEIELNFLELFEKQGIDKDRLEIYAGLPEKKDHLALYSKIDIGLDPFPFNGVTTTCEALWMGVPTVTLLGDRHPGRVCASILNHIGLREFVAKDLESYVEIAVQYAKNPKRLAIIRQELRARMKVSKLCDQPTFARSIENAYKDMWDVYISDG